MTEMKMESRQSDAVEARLWLDEETLDVTAYADLTDVDEVAIVVKVKGALSGADDVIVWLDRVRAIALAGQIAAAASASQTTLPHGHGADGA